MAGQINQAHWDADNQIHGYHHEALQSYLDKQDTVFLAAFAVAEQAILAGIASARIEHKTYELFKWLYVDEVDTCADQRRRGVGSALMAELLQIAREHDCREVWLGTEQNNVAGNGLYKSLVPSAIDLVTGYTFNIRSKTQRS